MKKVILLPIQFLFCITSCTMLYAQEYPFRDSVYYYRTGTDSLAPSGRTLASFNYSSASRTNDSLFTDGIYFPANDCFGRNLWIRVRHIAEDPNGTNRGINISQTHGNPCQSSIMLGGWAGFLYDFEIYRDVNLENTRAHHLGSLYPTSITVASLEWMSGTCGSSEWISFAINNSGSTGWNLNSINFSGNNPYSNPAYSDTLAVYTTGSCYPPDGFTYTFPTGADSISFINASTSGYTEFKMSAGNVSHFQYGYEYIGQWGGYQGMSMAFGSKPTFTFNAHDVSCENGNDGAIEVNISGGIGPFTYEWNDGINTGNSITDLFAGTYHLTVTDQNGCGQNADTAIVVIQPSSGISIDSVYTKNLSCFNANDGEIYIGASGTGDISYLWNTGDSVNTLTHISAGSYIATVSDPNGCYVFRATVTQPDAPDTSVALNNHTITCLTAQPNASFQWIDCSTGLLVPDSSAASFTPSASGSYKAVVTVAGCTDTTACVSVTISGIDDVKKEDISIYPNPASDRLFIHSESNTAIQHVSIQNLMGQQLHPVTISGPTGVIDISRLTKGVYFVTLQTGNDRVTRKFIKE